MPPPRRARDAGPAALIGIGLFVAGCGDSTSGTPPEPSSAAPSSATTSLNSAPDPTISLTTSGSAAAPSAKPATGLPPSRTGDLYATTKDLIAFVDVKNPGSLRKRWSSPEELLEKTFGVGSVWFSNQGNQGISEHAISREACLKGLEGVVLQTEDQKATCGADYMVPIYKDGNPASAKVCVDIFEFPNRPCELPVVWISPSRANEICEIQGKRLCTQDEWVLGCGGSPDGSVHDYAYGDDLDLSACNTERERSMKCDPTTTKTTWRTCATNTDPTGAHPRCRSRFGVFDQHGNVAEIMKRWDRDAERTVTQLKGSAFFYKGIHMRPNEKAPKTKYPDHCAHDPRWHVEKLETAGHIMYHLGFRCCKGLGAEAPKATGAPNVEKDI